MTDIIKEADVKTEFVKIGVDRWAIDYMLDKSKFRIIKLFNVRNAIANILKQEMLSIGGDVAVNRGCVNCTVKQSDVLVMGTVKQIKELIKKMKIQVAESKEVALELEKAFSDS